MIDQLKPHSRMSGGEGRKMFRKACIVTAIYGVFQGRLRRGQVLCSMALVSVDAQTAPVIAT